MISNLYNVNGPPKGANTLSDQSSYDLIYKDFIVNSLRRNATQYPNPNNYTVELNCNLQKVYKAELIDAYVPAATDPSVYITATNNIFSFTLNGTTYQVVVQPGTYFSPTYLAQEISRLITLIPISGISLQFSQNLNRYQFVNSTVYSLVLNVNATNSITPVLQFNTGINTSGPVIVKQNAAGNLYVATATAGEYGSVGINSDPIFSNCILSGPVLTDGRIYLSLGNQMNGDTTSQVTNYNASVNNVPRFFCQIPNNASVSSGTVKTLLGNPAVHSSTQYYNPLVNNVNQFNVSWYGEEGNLLTIENHSFTVRVFYFQKRSTYGETSIGLVNYTNSGTADSLFK
jgi:hypothetical protein